MKRIILVMLAGFLMASCQSGKECTNQAPIFEKGVKGPEKIFTNPVWVKMLVTDPDKKFDTQVYNVAFEKSARTHWHAHMGGQILLGTRGVGYYQEQGKPARLLKVGDVVEIPANVVHWHGASPDHPFTHIGMSTQVELGPAKWSGPVTDEQYQKATAQ